MLSNEHIHIKFNNKCQTEINSNNKNYGITFIYNIYS